MLLHPRLRDLLETGDRETGSPRGHRRLEKNMSSAHHKTLLSSTQQLWWLWSGHQYPSMEPEGDHECQALSEELLIFNSIWVRKTAFIKSVTVKCDCCTPVDGPTMSTYALQTGLHRLFNYISIDACITYMHTRTYIYRIGRYWEVGDGPKGNNALKYIIWDLKLGKILY